MRAQISYVPEDIVLDLGRADLGHPRGREIVERHYRQSESSRPEFSRQNPAFVCLRHETGTNPGMFLKRIGDQWWACHYERSHCGSMRIPAPVSDEHKRQADYWARAAEDAGWSVELEHGLATGTRPDMLISGGPVSTGIEIQRYDLPVDKAVRRTTKALRASVLDVWFTNQAPPPKWAFKVPSVTENSLPWNVVPPRRAATATGLRIIKPARCTIETFPRCPSTGRRVCGNQHPVDEPWRRMLIDDVAARVPAGEIVAMTFRRTSKASDVLLVSPESLALYEDMTGKKARLSLGGTQGMMRATRPAGEIECRNNQPEDPAAVRCYKCRENAAGPGGILCPSCVQLIQAINAQWLRQP